MEELLDGLLLYLDMERMANKKERKPTYVEKMFIP